MRAGVIGMRLFSCRFAVAVMIFLFGYGILLSIAEGFSLFSLFLSSCCSWLLAPALLAHRVSFLFYFMFSFPFVVSCFLQRFPRTLSLHLQKFKRSQSNAFTYLCLMVACISL